MNIMLLKLIFDKVSRKLYCVNTDGDRYAEYDICFDCYAPHTPIANGRYQITHDSDWDMEYGHDCGPAYGDGWLALDRETGKGWHAYRKGTGRSIDSGTYGCIRSENEDVVEVCEAIDRSLDAGIKVWAEVVGEVEDSEFIIGEGGEQ